MSDYSTLAKQRGLFLKERLVLWPAPAGRVPFLVLTLE